MLRATRVMLALNALLASTAAIGLLTGRLPPASEHPSLARGMGTRELAGVVILALVAKWLPRDRTLIAFPMIFVGFNLANSIFEVAVARDMGRVGSLVVEAFFLSAYVAFAWRSSSAATRLGS
jgi:hypothetical protein